jgi:hypothetical protein
LIDFRGRDHFASLGVPGVGSLIVGTVHSEDSFIATVPHPQPPDITQEEPVDRSQNLPAQPSVGETGLLGLAEQGKLLDPRIEMGVRTIVEKPLGKSVVH